MLNCGFDRMTEPRSYLNSSPPKSVFEPIRHSESFQDAITSHACNAATLRLPKSQDRNEIWLRHREADRINESRHITELDVGGRLGLIAAHAK